MDQKRKRKRGHSEQDNNDKKQQLEQLNVQWTDQYIEQQNKQWFEQLNQQQIQQLNKQMDKKANFQPQEISKEVLDSIRKRERQRINSKRYRDRKKLQQLELEKMQDTTT